MSTISENNKTIAKNTLFLSVRMVLVVIVSLFTTRVVLNQLGVENYGIYNVVAGFVSMFSFLNASMANGIQRFYNYALGRDKEMSVADVYNTALQIQLIIAFIIFAILQIFGTWYLFNKMVIPVERISSAFIIFECSVISLFIVILQVPYSSAVLAYEKMNFFAYVSLLEVSAKLIIAYSLTIVQSDKLVVYGILNLCISILVFCFYWIFSKIHFSELRISFKFKKDLLKGMMSFSGWNVFGTFAYMFKEQGLNLLLNNFFGPIVNAAQGISYMISGTLSGFQSNIIVAFRPQLVKSYAQGNYSRVQQLFFTSSKFSFLMMTIFSIPIILEINFILNLWLGNNVPTHTATFTTLILLNAIISCLTTPLSQIVHASGKMKHYQLTMSMIILSIVPIAWLFLKFGFESHTVYVIAVIIALINQVVCCAIVHKIFPFPIKEYLMQVIIPSGCFLILTPVIPFIVTLFLKESFYRLCLVGVLTLLSAISVACMVVLNKKERALVADFLHKKFKLINR